MSALLAADRHASRFGLVCEKGSPMPKIALDDFDAHYLTVGRGPDVVMIHGLLGNLAMWHLEIVPKLRSQFRITTYDLRGHGYSRMTDSGYGPSTLATDLERLMDAWDIDRAALVGHSLGADVCLHFALKYRHRVSRIVAIEPTVASLLPRQLPDDWSGWGDWARKLEELGFPVPPERRRDIRFLIELSLQVPRLHGPFKGLPRNRKSLVALMSSTTLMKECLAVDGLTPETIPTITTPTLLIYGDQSPLLGSYEFLRSSLPHCEAVLLRNTQHFAPLEQPADSADHIRDFLTGPAHRAASEASGVTWQ